MCPAKIKLFSIFIMFILSGCVSIDHSGFGGRGHRAQAVGSIAVVGFIPGIVAGDPSGTLRSPLTGFIFDAEPVPLTVADRMSDMLFERMMNIEGISLFSPGQTTGVMAGLIKTEDGLAIPQRQLYQEVGKRLNADAVLVGQIYRWREREGKEYGVNRAASVAFDLQLISSADGQSIWRDKFDKTQKSLSEDLFDLETFIKARGKWMTADKLANMGLDGFFNNLKEELSPREEPEPSL